MLYSYYNSDLDYQIDLKTMTDSICNLVNSTANAIYNEASGTNGSSISANCTLVSNLLDCLVSNFSCPFMQNYFNGNVRHKKKKKNDSVAYTCSPSLVSNVATFSHYSSVMSFINPTPQILPKFVFKFLSGVNGKSSDTACTTASDCLTGEYCILKKCTKTLTRYHDAYGTGLEYDESENVVKVVDPTKGTWTEST